MQAKVYLGSHRVGRSEPAGLCGLRKQVTEPKEGLLELRREKGKENVPGARRGWGKVLACFRESKHVSECWVLHLKGFYMFPKVGIFRGSLRGGSQ